MKLANRVLEWAIGLLALTMLALALVLVIQVMARNSPAAPSSTAAAAQAYLSPDAYPPTPLGLPYPPPTLLAPSPVPPPSADELSAVFGTEEARWATHTGHQTATASVWTPGPNHEPVFGEQLIQDPKGRFRLKLASGWRAYLGGDPIIQNYEADSLPPGGLKIQLGISQLATGQSFEQWQAQWIALEASPDFAGANATISEPQLFALGQYTGTTYTITSSYLPVMEILLLDKSQVAIIGLTPANSPAIDEALRMLATLQLLP